MSRDNDRAVTPAIVAEHGLTTEEYDRLCGFLGRAPNLTELGIVSVMWSEHCSYKSSKAWLKRLPTSGARVIQGPGENAGVVDIGDGQAVVFKMESHNHPSFIEPYQGAATGVGGIMRDVFTMGARPIANLNALRYCPLPGEEGTGNPNGSARAIAGIFNETKNVLGLMPHPENAVEPLQGSTDGKALFAGIVEALS